MKVFNYNAAKSGAPVQTRDGRKARIICWDYKGVNPELEIIAIITEREGFEETSYHYGDGRSMKGYPCVDDLVMVSEGD